MGEDRRRLWKGARFPHENDSAVLLDVHTREIPGAARMRRYADADEVDLVIVGAGAGGGTLAQRLARRGWRIVILESGRFWGPPRGWGSHPGGRPKRYSSPPPGGWGEGPGGRRQK